MRLEDLLATSAQRSPEAIAALDSEGKTISYGGLERLADEMMRRLALLGVREGDRVGLCVPKSIGALGWLFGILKAGAAYVPVDWTAPPHRNSFVFSDCAVKAIVTLDKCVEPLRGGFGHANWNGNAFGSSDNFVIMTRENSRADDTLAPRDLAYILYTSGSTGQPKGVMHSHATALSFIDWCSAEFQPHNKDRFSSHAPFHFDLSILDIYVPIKHGASVVLIGSDAAKQPGTLAKLIAEQRITIWYSTPSILRMLIEHGKVDSFDHTCLRYVFFAGEVFPTKHLRALMTLWPRPLYYNLYGPTETNVCTYYQLPGQFADFEAWPIGRPCSGDETRVLLPDDSEAPRGSEGELVVAGGSVMLGYWNLTGHNERAFLLADGKRWYRTGDVVRENESGEYLFLGRRDRMVKRRGYRIELGEIEAALHRHPAIPEAAVITKTNETGDTVVHAFVAWTDVKPASTIGLKQFCSQNLPLYMIPDCFLVLPDLPKTSTDKIDYQRLKGLA